MTSKEEENKTTNPSPSAGPTNQDPNIGKIGTTLNTPEEETKTTLTTKEKTTPAQDTAD